MFLFCNSGLDSKGQKIEAPKAPKSQKIETPTADKVAQNEDASNLLSNMNPEQMKALLEKVGGKAESPKEALEAEGGSSRSVQKPKAKEASVAEEGSSKSAQKPEAKADTAAEEKSEKLAQGLGQMLAGAESKKG